MFVAKTRFLTRFKSSLAHRPFFGTAALRIMTLDIMTHSIMAFSIMTFSIMALSIMAFSIMAYYFILTESNSAHITSIQLLRSDSA